MLNATRMSTLVTVCLCDSVLFIIYGVLSSTILYTIVGSYLLVAFLVIKKACQIHIRIDSGDRSAEVQRMRAILLNGLTEEGLESSDQHASFALLVGHMFTQSTTYLVPSILLFGGSLFLQNGPEFILPAIAFAVFSFVMFMTAMICTWRSPFKNRPS